MTDEDHSGVDASALWRGMPEALARESSGVARLRNLSTAWRTSLALAGLGALALLVWTALGRADRLSLPRYEFWVRWLPAALLAAGCARSLLWPAHRRAAATWLQPLLLLASVALSMTPALLPELHGNHPVSLGGVGNELIPRALTCTAVGVLFGAACLGWVALFLQGPRTLGALPPSAWALFMIGQSALCTLHCPLTAPIHIALGHGALCASLLGVVWAFWALRCRERSRNHRSSG